MAHSRKSQPTIIAREVFSRIIFICSISSLLIFTQSCESNSLDENESFKKSVVEEAKPAEGGTDGNVPGGQDSITLTPATYDFGAVSSTSEPVKIEVLIRNDSASSVYLTEIGAANDQSFSLESSETCPVGGDTKFAPGATCFFKVAFRPASAGDHKYLVTVFFDNIVGGRLFSKSAEQLGRGITPLIFAGLDSIDESKVTTTKVQLTWPAVDGASTFQIFNDLDTASTEAIAVIPGGATSYLVQNLIPANEYGFRIQALNELNIPDGNKVVREQKTDAIGSFAPLATLNSNEGSSATGNDISLACTDVEGNKPTAVTILQVSDPFANCAIESGPFKVNCLPAFKTGHTGWNAQVKVGCILNDYPIALESTLNLAVADTNRAPSVNVVANQTVLAGTPMVQIDVNGTNDIDVDLDPVTYSCRYEIAGNGSGATTLCTDPVSPLRNADNTVVVFDANTGTLNWTPALTLRGVVGFKIHALDGFAAPAPNFATFAITVSEPPASPLFSTVNMTPTTPTSIAADTTRTVEFKAYDAGGNALASCTATVAFYFTGGTSTGTFESQSCNPATGVYTAQLRGNIAGTPSTIGATINGVAVLTALPTLQIVPGTIDLDRSFVTTAASEVSSGSSVNLTLLARDKFNNAITTGGASVTFKRGSSGAGVSNGTFSAAVDNSNGIYSGVFTGTTAGTATLIGATIGAVDIRSTLPTIRVNPGAVNAATSLLSLTGASTVNSGATRGVTVTAYDANNNRVTAGGATVVFSATGGSSTGSFSAPVDNNDGTYSANFTGINAGTATTISATLNGGGVSNTQLLAVTPGAPSLSQSTVATLSSTVSSGSTTIVRLSPREAAGNAITSGGLTVVFSRTGGTSTGTFAAPILDGDGTYYSTFTGVLAGTPTNIATSIAGSPVVSTLPSITVSPGVISPNTSLVSASNATVASGNSVTVTLTAKDAAGNFLTTGGSTVVFTRAGGVSTGNFGITTDNLNGTYTASFTGIIAGTATGISATIDGQAVSTAPYSVTVTPGAVHPAGSLLTVASTGVNSGNSVLVTVQATDAAGNQISSGGSTATFSHSGGTSTGTFTTPIDNGNGTYSSQFVGVTAGSATTISAALGGITLTQTRTVTVSAGTISPTTSLVTLTSSTVASGQFVLATLQAKDAAGNNLVTGGATVTFFGTGGTSTVVPGTVTDNSDGTYSAQVTGVISGSATNIKATIGGTPIASLGAGLTVTPGVIAASTSTISTSSATVASGTAITITLQAKDAAGNTKLTGGSLVTFSNSGGTSTGVFGTVSDVGNGTYTASFTGLTSGTATQISGQINGIAVTTTLPTIAVLPGAISALTSQVQTSAANISSGTTATFTLMARDANNNNIVVGGETVAFAVSGGTSTGTLGSVVNVGNGTYTANFTGQTSGTPSTINATINGNAVSDSKSIGVNPGAISTLNSITTISSSSVLSGATVLATMQAKDAAGNSLVTGGATVTFIASGGLSTVTFGATSDLGDGRYQSVVTGVASGSVTSIKAVISGTPVATAGVGLQVTPGSISNSTSLVSVSSPTVPSGVGATLTLTAKDAAGNNLATGGSTVVFNASGGTSTGTIGSVTDVGNGTYTATFTGLTSGTATQITAQIGGVSVTSAAATLTVVPGAISPFTSILSTSSPTVQSGSAVTITLVAKDANNNFLTTGGQTVSFSHAGGASTGTFSGTSDLTNGTYSATFTGVLAGSSTVVSATINAVPVTSTSAVTVAPGAISATLSAVTLSSGTVVSGSAVTATLQAKDAAGNNVVTGGSTIAFFATGGLSTVTFGTVNDGSNGLYTATTTGVVAGTQTTIKATVGGTPISTSGSTLVVTPGLISTNTSFVSSSSPTVVSGSQVTVTLTAKDVAGNNLSSGGSTVVFSKASGTATGSFGAVTDNLNGTYSAQFTGATIGTAAVITATIDGNAITTTLPTIGVLPGSISAVTSTMSVSSSTVASGSGVTLTLQAKDTAGNLISTGGRTVLFSQSGGSSTGVIGTTNDVGNGTYTATFTGALAGSPTSINATFDGTPVTSTSPTISVTPGTISPVTSLVTLSSSTVSSAQSVTATLQAKDAAGNNLLTGGATTTFFSSGGTSTISAGTANDPNNGTYTATITGVVSGSSTNIKATIGGTPISTSGSALTVTPGLISASTSVVSVSASTVASGSSITVTLQGRDVAGNAKSTGGSTVLFAINGGVSTGAFGTVSDVGNGTYTASFSGLISGSATQVTATIDGNAVTTTLPTLAVTPGPISTATSLITTSASTINSGTAATLTLFARDANNNSITTGGRTVVFTNSSGTSTGTISSTTDVGNGTYTASFTGLLSGSSTTVNGTIDGSAVTSSTTIGVNPGAISTANSATTLSAATVSSGQTVTATMQAKDAAGNNLTSGSAIVTFIATGGASTVTFGSTSDLGDGRYQAVVTGVVSGTATAIKGVIGGTPVSTSGANLAVTPGSTSIATSVVTASSSTVASSTGITLTLTAKDAAGNSVTAGGSTVTFTAAGGTSTGAIGSTTDVGNGTYTATFTGIISGTPTSITGLIGGVPVGTSPASVAVTPGAISTTTSTIGLSAATLQSGAGITATLTARDANSNLITTGGQTVAFSHSGGSSTGTFSTPVDVLNGTYTSTFTGSLAGSATTVNATINSSPVTDSKTLTVLPGAASATTSVVTLSSGSVNSGSSVTATLQAKDAAGNNLVVGSATITFFATGGLSTATFGTVSDLGDGRYQASVTGGISGSATTIKATVGGTPISTSGAALLVSPGAASAATSILTVSAATVNSGANVTLTLTAKDAAGNSLATGGRTVVFSKSAGSSTGVFGGTTDNSNGTYSSIFTGLVAGSAATITATIDGNAITTTLPTVVVTAGAITATNSTITVSSATVASGATVTLTLQAKDSNNNNIAVGGQTIVFSRSGGSSTGTIATAVDVGDGTYTAIFTGVLAGTATTINATVNATTVTSGSPTVTVSAGAISAVTSTVTLSAASVASGSAIVATLQGRDAAGNSRSTGGDTVVFTRSGGVSTGTFGSVTDNNNGTYSANFTGVTAGSATSIGATIAGVPVSTTLPTVTVVPGANSQATSTISVSSATVASNSAVTLTLQSRDASGNSLTSGGLTVVFGVSGGASAGVVGSTTDNLNGTYSATFTGSTAGSASTVNATINGSPVTSTLPTITVVPGPISVTTSILSVSSSSVASGSATELRLNARDVNNNVVSIGGATVVFSYSGGSSTGTIGTTTDDSNGTYRASFTGAIAGTATNISATIGGTPVTTTSPQVSVQVGTISLSQSLISVASASITSGNTSTLTLTAKDAAGNTATVGGLTVAFSRSSGTSNGSISATTDNGNGTYTAVFTGTSSGTATNINATIGGSAVTSTSPQITVNPGAISTVTSTVTTGASSVASGSSTTVTIQARDSFGNALTTGGATVTVSSGGGTSTGSLAAVTDNLNGTYTSSFTGAVSGTGTTIAASIGGTPITSTLPTVIVIPGIPSAATSTVTVSSSTVASGQTITLTLTARDANGNASVTGGRTVAFSRSGGVSTGSVGATTDNNNGTYSAIFTGAISGSATTITSTLDGSAVTTTLPTVSVTPGTASAAASTVAVSSASISAGSTSTLTLQARDAANNAINVGGLSIVFSRSGGVSTGTISSTTDNNNGTYTATFTGTTSGSATTISATLGGAAVTTTLPTITVSPGTIAAATTTLVAGSSSIVSGNSTSLTVQGKDAYGNNVTASGATVTLSIVGGSSTGTFGTVTDNLNGTYTGSITGVLSGTPAVVSASIGGTPIGTTLPTVVVTPGVASPVTSVIQVSSATVTSGGTVGLTVVAKDAAGNLCVIGGRIVAFSHTGGTSTGTAGATSDNGNGTYSATFTGVSSGTATGITASINGSAITTTAPTVTVTPGAVSIANSTVGVSTATSASGSAVTLTVVARDAASNAHKLASPTVPDIVRYHF